jgi:hypothetical protein
VSHQDSTCPRCGCEHVRIAETDDASRRGRLEIDCWVAPNYGKQNRLVEIGVGKIANRRR